MGWISRFVAIITCRSCLAVDEKALKERNKLRKKLGKNKILPQAPTDLDIKTERVETRPKGSPTSWDIFTVEKKKDALAVEDKQQTSKATSLENVGSAGKAGRDENAGGGDASLFEFALNYVKTEVIPGAVERFLAEQERDKNNVSVTSFGGSSDISMSVSDMVQRSITNAQNRLKQEQEQTLYGDKKKDNTDAGHPGGNAVEVDGASENK